jgi:molybdopterin-biosynthesis enzyme MoeA-like protein
MQVIMPTANSPASQEVVTVALLVIGDKILSGRTKDQNIGYIAEYLTAAGIDLREVRVVGHDETAIVDALNALRLRYAYVFTTGGIGPTHGDITADCVAKSFGVPIDIDPRALAILHEWLKTTGAEMNEARLRMTRIPKGAELILNKVSGAPGFWIGNVIVMAGVPSIMQAMLDEVAPKLKPDVRMLSETVRADAREGDIGRQLGEIAKANPEVAIGSHPFFDPQHGVNTNVVLRAHDARKLAQAKRAVEDMLKRAQSNRG